jgi:hypothetical protein
VTRRVDQAANYFVASIGRGYSYLVTAKHVIDGIRDKGCDAVCSRVNFMDGQARWLESPIDQWLFHPTDSDSVDVAVMRCTIPEELDHHSVGTIGFATQTIIRQIDVGVGDDLFLTGLFANHHGTTKNIPIIRVGNIAAMPEEPIEVRDFGLMEAYLVEARSLGGISGSPVFVHMPAIRAMHLMDAEMRKRVNPMDSVHYLLGLMHGHWDTMLGRDDLRIADRIGTQNVNMGIAIVVPAYRILEVIEQPLIRKGEEEREKTERAARLPKADNIDSGFTQPVFEDALKRASQKVSDSSEPESEGSKTSK